MAVPRPGMQVTSQVRLSELLKRGGMGSVWLAEHEGLQTKVVVKFMDASSEAQADARARFSREAAAASQVKSPHVVQVFDHGVSDDGTPYIVMEYLEGHDLETHLEKRGALGAQEVIEIFTQLSRALEKTHAVSIVHRDLKPGNIFLCDAGDGALFVKLLDFGIAKGAVHKKLDAATQTGSMMGSPFYMSPEQIVGSKEVDARTDLWALGVIGFETLTGVRPFEAETLGALALLLHNAKLPVPSEKNAALPKRVDTWFARACARDPNDRFGSARELTYALATALGSSRDHDRRTPSPAARASAISTANTLRATSEPAPATTSPKNQSNAVLGSSTQLGMETRRAAGLPTKRRAWPLLVGAAILTAFGVGVITLARSGATKDTLAKDTWVKKTSVNVTSASADLRPLSPTSPVTVPAPSQTAVAVPAPTLAADASAPGRRPVVTSVISGSAHHPAPISTAVKQDDIY